MPQSIQRFFNVRENKKNLRGKKNLFYLQLRPQLMAPNRLLTVYNTAKAWNALPDKLRSVAEFGPFKNEIRKLRNL